MDNREQGIQFFCHGSSTEMCWRGRFHVHRTQLLLSAGVGWEGTLVDWNGEGWMKDKEISRGGGGESLLCRQL